MAVSERVKNSITQSSWIRKMFEEGARLKAQFGEDNVFDFSLGNPDLDPPPQFFDKLNELVKTSTMGKHGYMPNAGFPHVRESIAQKVKSDHGIEIDSNSIIMTCGAAGGLNTLLKTILNPGDEVIVPKPYFTEYRSYIENHSGELVLVNTNDDFSLNLNSIEKAINKKTKAIIINTPNNPTGKVYKSDEIQKLAELLNSKNNGEIYLISDEPYREIIYDDTPLPSILKLYPQSILVYSYSKTLSIPGERIGYIAVNPYCKEFDLLMSGLILCNRILGFVNAPALMQRVVASLNDVTVNIDPYRRRRDIFIEGLTGAGYEFVKPDGAFYIFCKSPIEDDIKFAQHLKKYNVLVVPGSGFGGPGYFRIAFCVSENIIKRSIPKFNEALESL
ncbi:pyridoxal phosphate-dependent aminotransferase [Spirochaetota bacterium]